MNIYRANTEMDKSLVIITKTKSIKIGLSEINAIDSLPLFKSYKEKLEIIKRRVRNRDGILIVGDLRIDLTQVISSKFCNY